MLSFFGCFFAHLTIEYYNELGEYVKGGRGYTTWMVNIVRLVALFVGGMGFPALVIFPVFLFKR